MQTIELDRTSPILGTVLVVVSQAQGHGEKRKGVSQSHREIDRARYSGTSRQFCETILSATTKREAYHESHRLDLNFADLGTISATCSPTILSADEARRRIAKPEPIRATLPPGTISGNLLRNHLERYDETEGLSQSHRLDPNFLAPERSRACSPTISALRRSGSRRKAVGSDRATPIPWNNLGSFLTTSNA
jgi:hypothetical protein